MDHARVVAYEIVDLVRTNRHWMGWNLLLAMIPAILGALLLWRPHRRTLGWWAGIGAFVLFLPNAPYVVTDLIHLRWMIAQEPSGSVVVFGVLPLMAAFIVAGYLSYLFCLEIIVREVHAVRPATERWAIELPVHAVCAIGVVLGRVARLNSWDTVTDPRWTAERIFNTVTWRGAPFATLAVFIAMVLTTTVLRAVVVQVLATGRRIVDRGRPAARGAPSF